MGTAGPTKNPTAGPTITPIPPTICPEKIMLHDENRTSIFNSSDKEAIKCYDTSLLTDMVKMFHKATEFNGDVSDWDVSSVTDMNGMFNKAARFNGDISDWDVSSVTDMNFMFRDATEFNSEVSDWNVSSVTDMRWMFAQLRFPYTTEFNGDVSDWDVSSVTDISYMFYYATKFNSSQICKWNVGKNTDKWLTGSLCSSTSCCDE